MAVEQSLRPSVSNSFFCGGFTNVHISGSRPSKKPPKFNEKTPRDTKRAKMGAGEGKKSAKFWATNPSPTLRGPTLRGPGLRDPKLRNPLGSHFFLVPELDWPKLAKSGWPKRDWPKSVPSHENGTHLLDGLPSIPTPRVPLCTHSSSECETKKLIDGTAETPCVGTTGAPC